MKPLQLLAAISLATLLFVPRWAMAGEGHDHGTTATAATGTALPRFAAVSDLFELVGVLKGQQITLYLDRAADNSPVTEATIELEINGKKYQAVKRGSDEFELALPEAPKPGVLAITATVIAMSKAKGSAMTGTDTDTDTDLLAGELDIHEAAHADEAAHAHSGTEYAVWAVGGMVALAALAGLLAVGRRALSSRQVRAGGAA